MIDYQKYKYRIADYLSRHAKIIATTGKEKKINCFAHADSNPSAIIYADRLWCPVCDKTWDIYDCVEFIENESDRAKQYAIVETEFGSNYELVKFEPKKTEYGVPVPLNFSEARKIFNRDVFQNLGELMKLPTDEMTAYPYKDKNGNVVIVDVRYSSKILSAYPHEDKSGNVIYSPIRKKQVVSFYYDGAHVKAKGCPVVIYGLDRLAQYPELPILIVEGAKTAEFAQGKLPDYNVITWNGGSKKSSLADWSQIADHKNILIYPDDDQKTDNHGNLISEENQPGLKAAIQILEKLPQAKIIRPILEARIIKPDGADLEEAFEAVGVDFVRGYLKSDANIWNQKKQEPEKKRESIHSNHDRIGYNPFPDAPFRVLGIADDGRGYFLNKSTGRIYDFALDSLSAQKLMQIADLSYWTEYFEKPSRGKSNSVDWEMVYNAIIQESNRCEFIPENLRGRGAWKEPDGRICYHDGRETIGQYDNSRVFIRKTQQKIGIDQDPLPEDKRNEIRAHIENASFESKLDAIRLLGWSALAPFAGALPWRPAAMLTAPPGTGKSTLLTNVVKPLTKPVILNGGESTPAGIRQIVARDSTAILLDEIEDDTRKKKENREEIFSMMRQSTSDEAPITAKGTADQKGMSYNMRNMFFFSAISNLIESKADDSRILKINLVRQKEKPPSYWTEWNRKTRELLTDETCDRIRSHTWQNLTKILKNAQLISDIMQEVANRDSRQSFADSMLFSAYFTTWERPNISANEFEEKIRAMLIEIFRHSQHDDEEEADDEPDQALEKILSHRVLMPESRRELSIREAIYKLMFEYKGLNSDVSQSIKDEIMNTLMRYGIKIQTDDCVAIRIKNPDLAKITERGQMYHKSLQRHTKTQFKKTKPVYYPGGTARAIILKNIVSEEKIELGLNFG